MWATRPMIAIFQIMDHNAIIEKCISFYLDSGDFNGYPISRLIREFGLDETRATALLAELIESDRVTVEFGEYHPNPHIKAFEALESTKQLELLRSLPFSGHFCIYPSPI